MWSNALSQMLRDALILTPRLYGNDGISVVSREIVSAFANSSVDQLEVWLLHRLCCYESIWRLCAN
ncbi:hypothetical protein SBA1_1180025 [Candidatus Sulfotelmatobacter kueseliae]|uniref:Uncharacterized protein n=1 Tax=Candidatus Sulfotelmatobacter kueseliae TaxID=2042962 RepID=A0A2U3K1P4_9BACT|nr:hypothetical protein SBA1_1180025 [Candidatus Sulfotelmatobacter kueseliae]